MRSASSAPGERPSSSPRTTSRRRTRWPNRLAIIDQEIVAEGTADELKRKVAGDVVTIVVSGATGHVLEAVRRQSFVREATSEDGVVRLYVDRGETAVPLLLRVLDGEGLEASSIALHRPSLDDVFLLQTGRSLRDEAAGPRQTRKDPLT